MITCLFYSFLGLLFVTRNSGAGDKTPDMGMIEVLVR